MPVNLSSGAIINNSQLCEVFLCSPQGGMRRSHKTNTLVLISNHVESIYEDQWIGDVLHYTGMGTHGDQTLTSQNKTLDESDTNGVEVHLFEVFRTKEYTYRGIVRLASTPYQATQPDSNNQSRNVWIFPLKLIDSSALIREEDYEHATQTRARAAKKLSDAELLERVQNSSTTAGIVEVKSKRRQRSPYIVELANRRANGICQLCNKPAPFEKNGTPYLEVHHIVPLADQGDDSLSNTVALCPNCHRKMHALALKDDVEKLLLAADIKP